MKKAIAVTGLIISLLSGYLYAKGYQAQSLGYVLMAVSSATATDIMNSTDPVSTQRWCYNCTANGGAGTVCYSTSATNAFSYILSTGTVCK